MFVYYEQNQSKVLTLNLLDQFHEEAVNKQIVHQGWFVAHWTDPLWLLLIHLKIELSVEALKMVTSRGSTRGIHPHLAERTGQRHFTRGRGNLLILVRQLLLDESHSVVWLA